MKKYCVTIIRIGCLFVEAETAIEAMEIANHQTTDTVSWSDDWEAAECVEDGSALDYMYIREKAFD